MPNENVSPSGRFIPGPMRDAATLNGPSLRVDCTMLEKALDAVIRARCSKKTHDVSNGHCLKKGEPCRHVEIPKIEPCIHVRWGDGANDHLETDDTEVLCITVCNNYSNVILRNFMLSLV